MPGAGVPSAACELAEGRAAPAAVPTCHAALGRARPQVREVLGGCLAVGFGGSSWVCVAEGSGGDVGSTLLQVILPLTSPPLPRALLPGVGSPAHRSLMPGSTPALSPARQGWPIAASSCRYWVWRSRGFEGEQSGWGHPGTGFACRALVVQAELALGWAWEGRSKEGPA